MSLRGKPKAKGRGKVDHKNQLRHETLESNTGTFAVYDKVLRYTMSNTNINKVTPIASKEDIEREIESLTRVVNNLPLRLGGRLLMKIAKLKRKLAGI